MKVTKIFLIVLIIVITSTIYGCSNSSNNNNSSNYQVIDLSLDNYENYLIVNYTEMNYSIADAITITPASSLLLFENVIVTYSYKIIYYYGDPITKQSTIILNIGGYGSTGKIGSDKSTARIISITGKVKLPN